MCSVFCKYLSELKFVNNFRKLLISQGPDSLRPNPGAASVTSLVHSVEVVEGGEDILRVAQPKNDFQSHCGYLVLEKIHRKMALHHSPFVCEDRTRNMQKNDVGAQLQLVEEAHDVASSRLRPCRALHDPRTADSHHRTARWSRHTKQG